MSVWRRLCTCEATRGVVDSADRDAVIASDAEEDVSTPSTLVSHLTVFLFGLQSAVHPSFFVPVVLHW